MTDEKVVFVYWWSHYCALSGFAGQVLLICGYEISLISTGAEIYQIQVCARVNFCRGWLENRTQKSWLSRPQTFWPRKSNYLFWVMQEYPNNLTTALRAPGQTRTSSSPPPQHRVRVLLVTIFNNCENIYLLLHFLTLKQAKNWTLNARAFQTMQVCCAFRENACGTERNVSYTIREKMRFNLHNIQEIERIKSLSRNNNCVTITKNASLSLSYIYLRPNKKPRHVRYFNEQSRPLRAVGLTEAHTVKNTQLIWEARKRHVDAKYADKGLALWRKQALSQPARDEQMRLWLLFTAAAATFALLYICLFVLFGCSV